MPAPIITFIRAVNSKGNTLIGKLDTATIEARFSTNDTLADVTLEYFYDNLEKEGETLAKRDMKLVGGLWTYKLPKKPDRTLVRYRILADLGKGQEQISPRKSDPYSWHAYFVMPKFTDTRKYFELTVSRKGISQLSKNAAANPRSGYRPAKNIKPRGPWNDTVHGILVYNGEVRDVYARWNGSFFPPQRQPQLVEGSPAALQPVQRPERLAVHGQGQRDGGWAHAVPRAWPTHLAHRVGRCRYQQT